jgi:deoxyribonuclease-4
MRFGPAGYPEGSKGPKEALDTIKGLGLNGLEIEYVRGSFHSKERAIEIGMMARERDIRLTAHAPYFVSLNSENEETRAKSLVWIMETVRAAHNLGAYSIAVHAGTYGKNAGRATENIIAGISACRDMMDDEGIKDVTIGLETMGKQSQWGTLREISEVMDSVDGVHPVLDVCHMHARTIGSLRTVKDMDLLLDEFFPLAGDMPHMHISGVKYGSKGELEHLPLSSNEPDMSLLVEAMRDRRKDCTFVCESPLLEKDAVVLMNMFAKG